MTDHGRLIWERDGRDWPNREASRFVEAAGIRWHVQVMGEGPAVLLIHGTGASSHSWAPVAAELAKSCRVVAPDLPGHAFSATPPAAGMTLPGMAAGLSALLAELGVAPAVVAGHSAGAAILTRMALDGRLGAAPIVSVNGAFLPFGGLAGQLFSPIAKLLVQNSVMSHFFAWRARSPEVIDRLLSNTGSRVSAESTAVYSQLVGNPHHVAGALAMMANWDLVPLAADLPRLTSPLVLVIGSNDRTVKPDDAFRVRDLVKGAKVELLRGLGHLAHEEQPHEMVRILTTLLPAQLPDVIRQPGSQAT